MEREVIARAPASVANVIVGFDLLGFSIPIMYDEVKIRKIEKGVTIKSITGVTTQIPTSAPDNTAGFALLKMIEDQNLDYGFEIDITKGIPLGSGLGGSAASAVAAVVAANELLDQKLSKSKLFQYAIQGESVASGNFHGDNIGASLFGGLIGCINKGDINDYQQMEITSIPIPEQIRVVIAYPNFVMKTKEAREIIKPTVSLHNYVKQSMNLASFIIGCFKEDVNIFKSS
ncbi:MAG: homoserine kinase, partial [Candidatus Heimdallarchaeota archaeon]|nr:homoserine kinase [Candidatus Heimdallarchaeota archaeon]